MAMSFAPCVCANLAPSHAPSYTMRMSIADLGKQALLDLPQ